MSMLDRVEDEILVPMLKTFIAFVEVIMTALKGTIALWPIWLLFLIVAACVKVLNG